MEGLKTKDTIGYVFYHNQDKEDLDKYKECYLAFGSFKKKIKSKDIAEKIIEILFKYSIPVLWNGDTNTRIKIKCLE